MSAALLTIDGLGAGYAGAPAIEGVSLQVAAGETVALLGANGAGKSTILKAVMGLLRPSAGALAFDGRSLSGLPPERRAALGIGYVPEGRRPFPGMSVRENLEVACPGGAALRRERLDRILALFPQLEECLNQRAWRLSGGQQQMLAVGRALMANPRLLLLDEPSLGLAPQPIADLSARLAEIAIGGTAILLAEQNVGLALGLATRAIVLRSGRVVHTGEADALRGDDKLAAALLGE